MSTLSLLIETLYLEVAGGRALPLIAAACPLPAAGRGHLVAPEGQSEIEFCLLSSHASRASEHERLGRWRVYGLSSAARGEWEAEIRVLVGVTGQVQVSAALGPRSLHVVPLTGRASAPIASWQLPPQGPLAAAQERARAGDLAGARGELGHLVRANPGDTLAWTLLASLLDDPARQADCYRQVLRVDPGDERAVAILRALERRPPTVEDGDPILRCDRCGGRMEVRFVGSVRDKRAVCRHCGTEVDLPDAYRRVETRREREDRPWGSRLVETTITEARDDRPLGAGPAPAEETLDELRELLRQRGIGNVNTGILRALAERRQALRNSDPERPSAAVERDASEAVNDIVRRLGDGVSDPARASIEDTLEESEQDRPLRTELTPEELVRLAGNPLPPQERIKCPECGTLVSRSRARCSWCGKPLSE